jgi:hypothetical protein
MGQGRAGEINTVVKLLDLKMWEVNRESSLERRNIKKKYMSYT